MSRPTKLIIEPGALLHNLAQIRGFAPGKKIITMVKANAYGCGLPTVIPALEGQVDGFGVACIEEAMVIRKLGSRTPCILFQGIFSPDELKIAVHHDLACVLHQQHQVQWLLSTPLAKPIKIWVKVNTGMHRLGFKPHELQVIMDSLQNCPWVDKNIGLMTHFACADEPERDENLQQISVFERISVEGFGERSMANSAAIIAFPQTHADVVRPGIMLYGVSPFADKTAIDLGLLPVMRFVSAISAIHNNPPFAQVGYSGTWYSDKATRIGIVAVGYGDGYPRHIAANTPVWIQGKEVPIVGRVSMDMLAVDLTDHSEVQPGAAVELWGVHILVERIAQAAGTSAYELLCQISQRVHGFK
ncbi:MAG: alanine racemase [Legionella sp.]|uniref:alanine racemase n=1 Tax=Legionella sp. TaxID=459 RepID=UPI0039E67EAF